MLLCGLSSENALWISPPLFVRLLVLPYDLIIRASQVALTVKNLPANAGDVRGSGSILWSERSPGGGHGNPLQYSCLESPMERGAWGATVHGVTEKWTQMKPLGMNACTVCCKIFYFIFQCAIKM